MFWGSKTILLNVWNEVPELIDEEARHPYQTGDTDGEEAKAYFANVEIVDRRVDQREDFEKRVIYAVCERSLLSCQLRFQIKLISTKMKTIGYLKTTRMRRRMKQEYTNTSHER
jgi:hypothetical protein